MVEVITAFEVFSYGRAFRSRSNRQERAVAQGEHRTRQRDVLRELSGTANAALSDGDVAALEELDGYVAPARSTRAGW